MDIELGALSLFLIIIIFTPVLDIICIAILDRCPKWLLGESKEKDIFKGLDFEDSDLYKDPKDLSEVEKLEQQQDTSEKNKIKIHNI